MRHSISDFNGALQGNLINVNEYVHSLMTMGSAEVTTDAPEINILYYTNSLISSGKNSFVHFAAAIAQSLQFSFLRPPGTQHC